MKEILIAFMLVFSSSFILLNKEDSWLLHARISTPYGYDLPWEKGVERAINNGVNVILDWAGFSDTYEGRILYFNNSIDEFGQRAKYMETNYPDIKYIVYLSPFEMITENSDMNKDGKDDDGKNSTYTDHADWLQMGIDGRKAVFYGSMPGMPFWVDETSEDAWLSPSNREYRNIIMAKAKEIAKLVDAIWFDVPHLSFEYGENWKNQWCSVDEASRNDFYNDTGLILNSPPIKEDWENETWLKFVEWRYKQVIDYIKEFNRAIKEGNENCKLVIETSTKASVDMTQHGCDISQIPYYCDVIAHEYGGPFYEVQYYSWIDMLANLKIWKDFDEKANRASWLLSYVLQGKTDLARFHASLVSTMGFNYYTAGSNNMGDIVDEEFMRDFFDWMKNHDEYFYGWKSNASIALLFSRHTLDYLDRGRWEGYAYHDEFQGVAMMLIESNIPFKVITEDEIDGLKDFEIVILPCFACMNESEAEKIREYVSQGGKIIAINETSLYNKYGSKRDDFLLKDVFGIGIKEANEWEIYENSYGKGKSIFTITPLGRYYYWAASPWSNYNSKEAENIRKDFLNLIEKTGYNVPYEIDGNVIAIPYENNGKKMLRIINFDGISLGNAFPSTQQIKIKLKGNINNAILLDFMGGWRELNIEKKDNFSEISFTIYTQANLIYSENENIYANIKKPEEGKIYLMDREIMAWKNTLIIGKISIEVETNGERVKFYVDENLKYEDASEPYSWLWDEHAFGRHEIKVIAYGKGSEATDKISIFIINL